jgi:hypothetical protein
VQRPRRERGNYFDDRTMLHRALSRANVSSMQCQQHNVRFHQVRKVLRRETSCPRPCTRREAGRVLGFATISLRSAGLLPEWVAAALCAPSAAFAFAPPRASRVGRFKGIVMLHRSSPRLIVREHEQSWEAGRAAAQRGLPSKCPKLPLCVSRRPVCWSGALRTDSVLSVEVREDEEFVEA